MASNGKILDLLEQEVEDFINTQAEKVISFEDDPMAYILNKYPSLDDTLSDLMTKHFGDYVMGIYVMAPKPTTFKILLHNGQFFYLIWAKESYVAKIQGKKYYLLDLGAEEYAVKAIADLLTLGKPPGAKGPDDQEDNVTITDTETEFDVKDEEGEEELTEDVDDIPDSEKDDYGRPFVEPKGSRTYLSDKDIEDMKPSNRLLKMMGEKKIKIVRESLEPKKTSPKLRILKESDAEKGIEILKKELGFKDEDFIKQSSLTYKLLVPRSERFDYATKIDKIEDFNFDPNLKGSSIGGVKYGNSKF